MKSEGSIAYDEGQHVILFNEVAEKIFGIPIWKAKMMTLSECFSEVSLAIENPEEFCDAVQRHTPSFREGRIRRMKTMPWRIFFC